VYTDPLSLTVSSLVIGAFVPGIVALVLGRVHELVPADAHRQKAAWGLCTIAFAFGQAVGGYGLSAVFARTGGGYGTLFLLGAAAFALCCVIEAVMAALRPRPGRRRHILGGATSLPETSPWACPVKPGDDGFRSVRLSPKQL
jgi:predicted MFS family arabinose efflux permease